MRKLLGAHAVTAVVPTARRSLQTISGLYGRGKIPSAFKAREYGMRWYPTKETLISSGPGPVIVAHSSEIVNYKSGGSMQVKKYGSFQSHEAYWNFIDRHLEQDVPQGVHEVIQEHEPRCLYFDLDGKVELRGLHIEITEWLTKYVRWFFSGDRLNWKPSDPEPIVLASSDPSKYSCHVVFPQIQFENFTAQSHYMAAMLNALPAMKVELEDGTEIPILEEVVDRVPYMRFQLFRGPYACKLSSGRFRRETELEPEGYFRGDPLAFFAGHVDLDYALELPALQQLLAWNEELRDVTMRQRDRLMAAGGCDWRVPPGDLANMYLPRFQNLGGGSVDLAGLPEVLRYKEALRWLHPERAKQWWSWFRICGVTWSMLQRYGSNAEMCQQIWQAHHNWSSGYQPYCAAENEQMVNDCEGKFVSDMPLLSKLVRYDNPNMEVLVWPWKHYFK